MTPDVAARLQEFAQYLDDVDEAWQVIADAIVTARDKGRRVIGDRDSGDVLNDVIRALRNTP